MFQTPQTSPQDAGPMSFLALPASLGLIVFGIIFMTLAGAAMA